LYNSLNSISALTMIAPEKAQDMIGKLSDFLRSSVRREGQEKISIVEELGYIEAYLSIESVRFGNRLRVEFEKEYTDDAQIPPFLLQPLLENAIKFGLYGKTGNVTIRVHIALQEDMLHVKITNPFDHDSQPPRGTGFGLEGIRRRLYLLFARTDLLETHKADNTFITTLKIPQHV
jgi:two-component system, LytTR family, sensor kinase